MQDKLLVLSEDQAITASAPSDFYIDDGAVVNTGYPFIAEVLVREDFAGDGTLTVTVEAGEDNTFADVVTLATSPAIESSKLLKGASIRLPIGFNTTKDHPFIRVNYTASADFSKGKVTTVLQPAVQTNGVK